MSDRVEYINRRLDQLEAAAKAADVKQGDPEWKTNQVMAAWPRTYRVRSVEDARPIATVSDVSGDYEADATEILDGKAVAEHIALNDPAAVLARVAADRAILALFAPDPKPEPGPPKTDAELHARRAHPAYEYDTTEGPRKAWDDEDVPPCGDDGEPDHTWERNVDAGDRGWARFDYTEEAYWRRRLPDDQIRKPAVHPVIRLMAEGLGWTGGGDE